MSETAPTPAPSLSIELALHPRSSRETRRRLLASLLSAFVPGTGQLFLGQRRKGLVLLGVFAIICLGFWPFRLLRFFPGLIVLVWVSLGLALYSTGAALLGRSSPHSLAPSKWWMLMSVALTYVGFNVVFTSLLFAAGFRAMEFSSSAMEPMLIKGDKFLIDRKYYRYQPCDRDDLVVMQIEGAMTVKRVIAVSGDTIEGKSRQVVVNGLLRDEPFVQHTLPAGTNPQQDTFGPLVVSAGKYFVMGDNRDASRDSRSSDFGQVDREAIAGRPLYVYLSHPWSRRGRRLY